jgi:serine/threonine protein phosphatase PrpC
MHPYEDRILVDRERRLFAIADGVSISSQGNGAIAAEFALRVLDECFFGDIASAITNVHRIVLLRKKQARTVGETTLTVVVMDDRSVHVGNVGDSPAILLRGKRAWTLTSEDRDTLGSITQVIGYPSTVTVHTTTSQIKPGDVIIVASDGVGHVLMNPYLSTLTGKPSANMIAASIIDEANTRKSEYDDDKSVIVIRIS